MPQDYTSTLSVSEVC